jgi:hypothetical protein
MEMRRHDPNRPAAERFLLWAYWLLSGYGLRAARAMGWLISMMLLAVATLMLFGLPAHPSGQRTAGILTGGHAIALTTTPLRPHGAAPNSLSERFSWPRTERAARVVVNSAVFRSAGQGLTLVGTYVEMGCRLTAPVLLILAVLAVRGRVRR